MASRLPTADIVSPGKAKVSTGVMGEAILRELDKLVVQDWIGRNGIGGSSCTAIVPDRPLPQI